MTRFIDEFRPRAHPFALKVESLHNDETVMLDVRLFKSRRVGPNVCFGLQLFQKPTSVWRPLNLSSYHFHDVHAAWPMAHAVRIKRRCSDRRVARKFKQDFVGLYRIVQGEA